MAERFTTRILFTQLGGKSFRSYESFEGAVKGLFAEHVDDFPARYTHREAIRLGVRKGWVVAERSELHVLTPARHSERHRTHRVRGVS